MEGREGYDGWCIADGKQNTYLIAINVTNKQKERYYHEYVPDLLDVRLSTHSSTTPLSHHNLSPHPLTPNPPQSLQSLSETRTSTLNTLWLSASSLETQTLNNSIQHLTHLQTEIPRNNPVLDSMMFARHNAAPAWQDPADFAFEPSPVWLDDDKLATDAASKTFLMNILTKSKGSLAELKRAEENNRREVEAAKRVRLAIREGKDKRDEVEVVRTQFHHQELLHEAERKRITAEVEAETIISSVGDVSRSARNHDFRKETFKIPTNCDLCGDRIWGLSAKGLSCEMCGFTCHLKCELKVPADCPGELSKEQKKGVKAERQAAAQAKAETAGKGEGEDGMNGAGVGGVGGGFGPGGGLARSDTLASMNTLSSGYAASAQRSVSGASTLKSPVVEDAVSPTASATSAAPAAPPTRRRMVAPPPTQYRPPSANGEMDEQQKGKMLYAYSANGDGEISVSEGQDFTVVEPDDGSGWIKIKPASFGAPSGLVPASYAELSSPPPRYSLVVFEDGRPVSTASASGSDTGSSAAPPGAPTAMKPKKQGPAVAPRRGAKKVKHVEALYTYAAAGLGEVDMEKGEKMVLLAPDQGDGWCEVESKKGKGVVPASWVREV